MNRNKYMEPIKYKVVTKIDGRDSEHICSFPSSQEVNHHLSLIERNNTKRLLYVKVIRNGRVIKEWIKPNFGT